MVAVKGKMFSTAHGDFPFSIFCVHRSTRFNVQHRSLFIICLVPPSANATMAQEATMVTLPPRTSSTGSSAGGVGLTSPIGLTSAIKDPELLLDAIDSTGRKEGDNG